MARCRIVVFALLALVGVAAGAQPALRTGESRYYTVHTNVDAQTLRPLVEHMDLVFGAFRRRFARLFDDRKTRPMNLFLVRTQEDYLQLLDSYGVDATGSGGIFSPRAGGLATWVENRDEEQLFRILQHEAFHQFAYSFIGRQMPVWANEGLAEYFGDAVVVNGRLRVGLVNERRLAQVRRALDGMDVLSFDQLIDIDGTAWWGNMRSGAVGSNQYAQAWSVAYFLAHGDGGKYQRPFEAYLVRLARGEPHAFAFPKVFGENRRPFERAYRQYIAQLEPDPYTTALKRLAFLAHALRWLAQKDQPMPADIDALREELIRHEFAMREKDGHTGTETVWSATDPDAFVYVARDRELPFALKASRDPDLPPMVFAPALRPRPGVVWHRDPAGTLRFQIDYD